MIRNSVYRTMLGHSPANPALAGHVGERDTPAGERERPAPAEPGAPDDGPGEHRAHVVVGGEARPPHDH